MSRTIYIAGPMRGFERFNFAAFEASAARWRAQGWHAISPAEMDLDVGFDPAVGVADAEFIKQAALRDLTAIVTLCDAISIPPPVQRVGSKGLRAEIAVAEWLGLALLIDEHWRNGATNA